MEKDWNQDDENVIFCFSMGSPSFRLGKIDVLFPILALFFYNTV